MKGIKQLWILAGSVLLVACATPESSTIASGAAAFVAVGLTQEAYVDACTTRGLSSLECTAEFNYARSSQQAAYRAKKQHEQQRAAEELSAELDAYLKSVENARQPD